MGRKKGIYKFIDSSKLPRIYKGIDWKNTIGYNVYFEYDDIKGYMEIIDYIKCDNKKYKLKIKYKDKYQYISPSDFLLCRIGNLLNKVTSDFKIEIGQTFKDDKRDLTIIDREYRENKNGRKRKYYKYKCNKCGFNCGEHYSINDKQYKDELWMEESNLLNNEGCIFCNNKIIVEGINDIPTTDPWMVKYFQRGYDEAKKYTYNSNRKIYPICPECGRIKNKSISINSIYNNKSIGCTCGDGKSQIEKYMFSLLEQLKQNKYIQDFNIEKRFEWCNYYNPYKNRKSFGIYDFVIEDKKIIIETDGGFHRQDNNMSGQSKEESQWIDNIKDKLANKNGYEVIRISDEGIFKENILHSELNKLFNLNNIDWNKCSEYSCSNLVKIACGYKKNNPNLTTTQIGKIMGGYDFNTVRKWMKIGNELGWCIYNGKEENKIALQKGREKGKSVEVFKDGISFGVFESINDVIKQLGEKFGIKLEHSAISLVCRGEKLQYKGFKFKYINEYHEEYIPKQKGKPLEMFKNNISLGIFKSGHELDRQSKKIFNIKLDYRNISNACRNNKPYKGYTFKYISREEYERRISEDPTLKESE